MQLAGFRPRLVLGLFLLPASLLAGCGQTDNGEAAADPFANMSDEGGRGFGETFERASRANSNSEPIDVGENDLPPVSATTEPVPVD